ncbi:MAG: nucleotidyltransferase domain-containing protein [Verrucomicrobiales bacterium]
MKAQIQSRLGQLSRERGIRILYACESGSRAWGFASPDSDYDVRFIYAHEPDWYVSIDRRDETIELPPEGDLDLVGWDLRKAVRLFAKSNGALVEWLHSPAVYLEATEITSVWRSLVPDAISPKSLACHYLGQCRRIWLGLLQSDQVRAKHYLYSLRSLLAANFVLRRRTVAPVRFDALVDASDLPNPVRQAIRELVGAKSAAPETFELAPIPLLHRFIGFELSHLEQVARGMRGTRAERGLLDEFLRDAIASRFEACGTSAVSQSHAS